MLSFFSEQNMLVEINNYDEIHNMPSEHVALDLARLWIHNLVDYKNKEQYWLHETIPIYLQYLFIRDVSIFIFWESMM